MPPKRKRDNLDLTQDTVIKPPTGTKSYTSGKSIKDALSTISRQSLVSFHSQIATPSSKLPLPITHPTILIIQHYLTVSPTCEEIFSSWQTGSQTKNDKLVDAAVSLLAEVMKILTPLPFFLPSLTGIVAKLVAPTEPYHELLNRLVQSTKREQNLTGLLLASTSLNVDPSRTKIWSTLSDGGSFKSMPKLLSMRKRTPHDGDPMDKPDIRHLALSLILPMLSTPSFQTHAKTLLPALYSNLITDPAITIYRVLTAIYTSISSRRTALTLLDESAIDHLLKLLPREDIHDGRSVSSVVSAFLNAVTATPGKGICFPDQGWYPRQTDTKGLHNRILANVLNRLHGRVADDSSLSDWVVNVLNACPELVPGFWPHSALSVEPRLDAKWISTMSFIGRVVSLPVPPMETFYNPTLKAPPPLTLIESILPSPLTKTHLTRGLEHPNGLVQHTTALTLSRCLQKLALVQNLFNLDPNSEAWTTRRRELETEARKRVPDVLSLITFAQKSAQSAPTDPETEEDFTKLTRAHLLTESALRLFGLYHTTLPSLAHETKFDIGKLLVSSSSSSGKTRREAREGSVVSDDGSVGSVGTLGTVGMGGGFGQSRGAVQGFEALSQVHVIRLLSSVDDWNWVYKAAGSQYTYFYHILQLYLSTTLPVTLSATSSLLHKLLSRSILFDHDPAELDIWLSSMPRAQPTPALIIQQIHLLSFLDDCVRRAMKTPYRYIEDLQSDEPISPIMSAILEQFNAKIIGQLIGTDAALVILAYVRRVILGLCGKQSHQSLLDTIVARLEATLAKAKDNGQPRTGCQEVLNGIKWDLRVFGGNPLEVECMQLADETEWRNASFEHSAFTLPRLPDNTRQGRFLLHLLDRDPSATLVKCLATTNLELQRYVFSNETIKRLFMSHSWPELADLAATLSDPELAAPIVDMLAAEAPIAPWIRFFSPQQAQAALKSAKPETVPALVTQTKSSSFVLGLLDDILPLAIPETTALIKAHPEPATIKPTTITSIISLGTDPAYDLLAAIAEHYPDSIDLKSITNFDLRLLPSLELSTTDPTLIVTSVVSALTTPLPPSVHQSATRLLLSCGPSAVPALTRLTVADFTYPLLHAISRLASTNDVECMVAVNHVVDLGLQTVVRSLSNDADLSNTDMSTITTLTSVISATQLDLKPYLVEPVITAVVQERLETIPALDLAAALTSQTMLKAGFIRQNLQLVFASTAYTRQTRSPTLSFISLLHKLFLASTYVSCQPGYIESLLPLYTGTLSRADQLILSLFMTFEQNRKLSTGSVLKSWSGTRAIDSVTSLDAQKVFATCTNFPLRRGWSAVDVVGDGYDPVFVLSLLGFALSDNITGLEWVEILRSNVLGLAICALASRDTDMRTMASYILAKTVSLISATGFQERPQLLYTLRILRHSTQGRLPTIATLFFAHLLRSIAHPSHYIYPSLSRHLLQRPTYDAFDVPGLYTMLYASGEGWKKERGWMLRLLRDGMRSEADWRVCRRRHVWGLLAGLYSGSLDVGLRRSILQVMKNMTLIPSAARSLITHSSLIPWLIMQYDLSACQPLKSVEEEREAYLELLENVVINSAPREASQTVPVEEGTDQKEDGKRSLRWLGDVVVFVKKALEGASSDRLETISRIIYRLSLLSPDPVQSLLPLITSTLPPSPTQTTIEHLFRASLALPSSTPATRTILSHLIKLDTETADWARRQLRT